MKHTILFSTLVMIFVLVPIGSAQVSSMRVTFSESVSPYGGGQGMGKVAVHDIPYNPNLQVFELVVPAASVEQCYASTDFSRARPAAQDRASLSYDFSRLSYELKIVIPEIERDNCRVLLVGETISTSDLAVWRANFGQTSLAEDAMKSDEKVDSRIGDGSVRNVSYQIDVRTWNW